MTFLNRDQILNVSDLQFEDVNVPQWGGTVRVVGMTGAQRDAWEAGITRLRQNGIQYNLENIRAGLLARVLVDEQGKRLFSDKDITSLGNKSAAALDLLFSVAQRLSGIGKRDIEELTENFPAGQNGGSISA